MDIKSASLSLIFFLISFSLFSQNSSTPIYEINWKYDAPLLLSGIGLSVSSYAIEQNIEPLPEAKLGQLSFSNFLNLDEGATNNYSTQAKKASDILLRGSLFMPLLLMTDREIRSDAGKISVLLSETFLLTYGFTNMTKGIVKRNRPYVFNPEVPLEKKLEPDARLSFFSGHTSGVASLSFFSAKVWSDYHPDSKWKPVVWTLAASAPAVTGYLRYKAGKHYFSDVATGYALGALVGYFVPHLHKIDRKSKKKLRLSTSMVDEVPVFKMKYRF